MRRLALLSLFTLFLVAPAFAQSEVGEVSFANSGSPEAQEPFLPRKPPSGPGRQGSTAISLDRVGCPGIVFAAWGV